MFAVPRPYRLLLHMGHPHILVVCSKEASQRATPLGRSTPMGVPTLALDTLPRNFDALSETYAVDPERDTFALSDRDAMSDASSINLSYT